MVKEFSFPVKDQDFNKSSWSKNNPKTCVAVAKTEQGFAVRDTKDTSKKTLFFTKEEWGAFVQGVKNDEFE